MDGKGEHSAVDMQNRDPNSIHPDIRVNFEDVLAEPDGIRSADCVWMNARSVFEGSKSCCYVYLSLMCGLPLACYWGCMYACEAFTQIWCVTPYLRLLAITVRWVKGLIEILVNCCCIPVFQAYGHVFSMIRINLTHIQQRE